MKRKLICIDIDGTLVNSEGKVSKENKDAIAKTRKAGHIVCLVTARPWRTSNHIYHELNLNTLVANYNGGLIHHPFKEDFEDIESKIPTEHLKKVFEDKEISKKIHSFILENKKAVYISKEDNSAIDMYQVKKADISKIGKSYDEYMKHGATGSLVLIKKAYDPLEVRKELLEKYGEHMSFNYWIEATEGVVLDISNKYISKGKALLAFADYYKIDYKDTISIGDSWNDVAMFHAAGKGIAVGNAKTEIKAEADEICHKTNNESAVAEILKKELGI